jgi:hypothetical protein
MAKDMRAAVEIPLDFPIKVEGVEIKGVRMRRPKARDELAYAEGKGSEARRGLMMVANLCDLSFDVVLEMDPTDVKKLEAQYAAFQGASPSGS